jgi:hypothetical protein
MKRTTINVAWVLGLLASQIAHATSITFELNYEYSGAHPSGPPPWVVIEISDDAAGVKLKISNSGLTGTEFTRGIYLNVADSFVGTLQFGSPVKQGTFDDPTIQQSVDNCKATGDGYFDILLEFETANNGGSRRFGAGESITYLVTSPVAGLDATDFNLTSVRGDGDSYHAAAHIQGIRGNDSGWIGDKPPSVPDVGGTAGLLLMSMLGLGWVARRKV